MAQKPRKQPGSQGFNRPCTSVLSTPEARFLLRAVEAAALGQSLSVLDGVADDLRADPFRSPVAEAIARNARAPLGEWAEMLEHLSSFVDSWRLVRNLEGPENFAVVLAEVMEKAPELRLWLAASSRRTVLGW